MIAYPAAEAIARHTPLTLKANDDVKALYRHTVAELDEPAFVRAFCARYRRQIGDHPTSAMRVTAVSVALERVSALAMR